MTAVLEGHPLLSGNSVREIDERHVDGLTVRLLWCPENNDTIVTVQDDKSPGDDFTILVRPDWSPVEVFNHPFAYHIETQFGEVA